jgi:hypothetical protein
MNKLTLDRALEMAEGDRWYGQGLMRECAAVLAAEVRRLQHDATPNCDYWHATTEMRCKLKQDHDGPHDLE